MYDIIKDMQDWPQLTAAHNAALGLNEAGFEAYIIGGAVRDILLGYIPKDFDLVTNATPAEINGIADFKQPRYIDTSQAYGVTRIRISVSLDTGETQDVELEIATYRRDVEAHLGRTQTKVEFAHLEDDIQRRDFTVNALALDPATYQLIDIVDGLSDLENGLIRFIGNPDSRIREDPLRILRAIRFKNQLGFEYDDATYQALHQSIQRNALGDIADDRIRFELTYMVAHKHRTFALMDLDELGALNILLPEITAQKGVAQPESIHAEGDVWQHCMLTMKYLPDVISPRLAWAALLHDAGKVTTARPVEDTGDRIRFDHHYAAGADIARMVLKRLGFGKRFREEVAWMIHHHLAIDELPRMRPGRAKHMMSHPAFADLLELHKADAHAAWSVDNAGTIDAGPADFSELERIWEDFQRDTHQRPPSLKHDLGIDGTWLMRNFGLPGGARIGEILAMLEEKYLDDEITSLEDAEAAVTAYLRPDSEDEG